jgi:competence protein ComEC
VLESLPVKAFYDSADSSSSAKTQGKDEIASASAIANAVQSQQGNYQPVLANQTISVSSTPIQLLNTQPAVLQLQIQQQIWLLLGEVQPDIQKQLANTDKLPQAQVLLWTGESLLPELLTAVQPKVAIASSSKTVDIDTAQLLRKAKIPLYWTGRDGAIQWTANSGFETTLETTNNDASLL